jgi:hypothetical protein
LEEVFSARSVILLRDATIEELLGEVFCVRYMPRLYNEEQLRLRESLETAVKVVNTEAEEATELEAVTRRQAVKTQKTEKA